MATEQLFSYKMTDDSGFAPNPFWSALTLATCKPDMRRTKAPGHWIAGLTSGRLCGDPVGEERLVYLMQVREKFPVADYFRDDRFQAKIPDLSARLHIHKVGDNIYRPRCAIPNGPSDFDQLPNPHHWDGKSNCGSKKSRNHDISGWHVLTSIRFVYFGRQALKIPLSIRPEVPTGMSRFGTETKNARRIGKFIDYVFGKSDGQRIVAAPHGWPLGDDSWCEHLA